jgi:hypothetical protein
MSPNNFPASSSHLCCACTPCHAFSQRVTHSAPIRIGFAVRAAAAVPLLLAAYGATMSRADRALLAALREVDSMASSVSGARPLSSARCARRCLDGGTRCRRRLHSIPDCQQLPVSAEHVCAGGLWLAPHAPDPSCVRQPQQRFQQCSGTCGAIWRGRLTGGACCYQSPSRTMAAPARGGGR